jgi:hypothetical protein
LIVWARTSASPEALSEILCCWIKQQWRKIELLKIYKMKMIRIVKPVYLMIVIMIAMLSSSCNDCITCVCYKNGDQKVEDDCEFTNDKDEHERTFKNHLLNDKGYDTCDCY